MAKSDEELLERLAQQARGEGVETSLFNELLENPPDAGQFTALVVGVAPHASDLGRFGITELALNLVHGRPGYRQAAEIAVGGSDYLVGSVAALARKLQGEDVLWWHDLLCRSDGFLGDRSSDDYCYQDLFHAHASLLLQERRTAMLQYLLVPDRGPGNNNVFTFEEIIALLDGCPPLERRFAEWIRGGRFEWRQPGDENARILGAILVDGLAKQPVIYEPLLAEGLARWRYLLTSGDNALRRRGLEAVSSLVQNGRVFGGRLMRDVVDHLDPAQVPETVAMREAVLAAWRVEGQGLGALEEPAVAQFAKLIWPDRPAT